MSENLEHLIDEMPSDRFIDVVSSAILDMYEADHLCSCLDITELEEEIGVSVDKDLFLFAAVSRTIQFTHSTGLEALIYTPYLDQLLTHLDYLGITEFVGPVKLLLDNTSSEERKDPYKNISEQKNKSLKEMLEKEEDDFYENTETIDRKLIKFVLEHKSKFIELIPIIISSSYYQRYKNPPEDDDPNCEL